VTGNQRLISLPELSPQMHPQLQIDTLLARDITLQKRILELSQRLDAVEVLKNQDTNMLTEGDKNLYYTDKRVRSAIDVPPKSALNWNGNTGMLTVDRQWDDLRTPANAIKITGALNLPVWDVFLPNPGPGTQLLWFDNSDQVFFNIQMPHDWWEGTTIYPHVHWVPVNGAAGNVVWYFEYTWANIDAVFPATTTVDFLDAAAGTANTHQIATHSIAGAQVSIAGTGHTISSMLVCRLYRDAGGPAPAPDTYKALAGLLEFDIHYQKDSFGSVTEFGKF